MRNVGRDSDRSTDVVERKLGHAGSRKEMVSDERAMGQVAASRPSRVVEDNLQRVLLEEERQGLSNSS